MLIGGTHAERLINDTHKKRQNTNADTNSNRVEKQEGREQEGAARNDSIRHQLILVNRYYLWLLFDSQAAIDGTKTNRPFYFYQHTQCTSVEWMRLNISSNLLGRVYFNQVIVDNIKVQLCYTWLAYCICIRQWNVYNTRIYAHTITSHAHEVCAR